MKPRHLILLRGLIREKNHWGNFLDYLQKTFPNSKIHCIDIPGAGDKYLTVCPLSISEIVKIMHHELLNLNIPEDEQKIMLAISLGGMIAAQWMSDFPNDFSHCALMNTSYSGLSPFYDRLKPSALFFMLKIPFLKGREREKRILQLVSNVESRFEEDADAWNSIQMQRPVSLKNTFRQLFAATKFLFPRTRPPHDLLVIACPMDRMVSVKCSQAIAEKWRAPIVYHTTAGHDVTGDDPAWVSQEIKKWLLN